MQSLIILSIAASALAAPLPGGADVVGNTLQGVTAASKGVAAGVGATVNGAVKAVDVDATYNTIGNNVGNDNVVKVLSRQAAVAGATKQGTAAVGGLVGAAVGAVGNVAANVGDVDVECNEILNNVGNGNDISILSRRDGAAVDGVTKQVTGAVGGLVGAGVGATVNAAVKAVTVIVDGNQILNGVLDGNTVKVLSARDGAAVDGVTKQGTAGAGGLVGAGVGAVVNAAVKAVTVIVDGNKILNGVLDGNTVKILSARDGAAVVDGVTKQGTAGIGGLVGAGVGAVANVAADAVNVDVLYNTIGNNVLNGNDVNVLRRDGAAVLGATQQGTDAVGGLVGAGVGATVNAAVKAVKVVLADNTIANGVLDGNNVKILRRDGAAVAGATEQGTGAVGGLVGAAVGVVGNVAANLVKVVIDNNTILNGVLDGNTVKILSN